jgi:predicted flap endonuclease-1-like 5' DNA nuclease
MGFGDGGASWKVPAIGDLAVGPFTPAAMGWACWNAAWIGAAGFWVGQARRYAEFGIAFEVPDVAEEVKQAAAKPVKAAEASKKKSAATQDLLAVVKTPADAEPVSVPVAEPATLIEPRLTVLAEPAPEAAVVASLDSVHRPAGIPAAREGGPDDLKLISGVGPKIEAILHDLGIYHFDQVAAWTPNQVEWVDAYLSFKGRILRNNWVAQADALAVGGAEEYIRRFGKPPR